MKIVKENNTYKAIEAAEPVTISKWEAWVSPYLTSNSSYGTISGDMSYTWFNGASGSGVTHSNGTTYTAYWEFPEPIKLSTVYWYAKSNPDRYGTRGTISLYSVDSNNIETSLGSAEYSYSNGGSNGSASLDDTIEVTKLKVTIVGTWSGANGVWHLPISLDGYIYTTRTYTPMYGVKF